jgi:hypothetical protein
MADVFEDLDPELEDDGEITFEDAPPQVKPTVSSVPAKPKKARKAKVATKPATAKSKKQHRVDTIDKNKLTGYLDKITNEEGYEVLSVTGSSSIMGSFDVVSVKNS